MTKIEAGKSFARIIETLTSNFKDRSGLREEWSKLSDEVRNTVRNECLKLLLEVPTAGDAVDEYEKAKALALEQATSHLASRAVFAEVKVKILEEENKALKATIDQDAESLKRSDHNYRELWSEFWIRQGFTKERVTAALKHCYELSDTEAAAIVAKHAFVSYALDAEWDGRQDATKWRSK